jgi:hypothetical protein
VVASSAKVAVRRLRGVKEVMDGTSCLGGGVTT